MCLLACTSLCWCAVTDSWWTVGSGESEAALAHMTAWVGRSSLNQWMIYLDSLWLGCFCLSASLNQILSPELDPDPGLKPPSWDPVNTHLLLLQQAVFSSHYRVHTVYSVRHFLGDPWWWKEFHATHLVPPFSDRIIRVYKEGSRWWSVWEQNNTCLQGTSHTFLSFFFSSFFYCCSKDTHLLSASKDN